MLGNVRFDLSFDFDIGLEILAGKKVREGLVDINKMLPLWQGSTMQINNGSTSIGASFGQAFLGQLEQQMSILIADEAIVDCSSASIGETFWNKLYRSVRAYVSGM